ncbi:MAG: M42 family metallopeptidase [Gemmatimonadetes bacterium]|nr:M42 family metallopeptidase [Gemmatimonadota bacterium]
MNVELLSELCRTPGPPGREERIREIVIRELSPLVDEIEVDRMGNVFATRRPRGRAGKGEPRRVMLSAHMDEISLIVTHVDEHGFLRFAPLGGFDPKTLSTQRVIVHGCKDVLGVIGSKPIHIMTDEERQRPPKLEHFFIDLGLPKAKVDKLVSVGDLATRERDFVDIGDSVCTKSLDDRVGVFVMIEAVRALKSHAVEVIAVATTQEEVGIRGATVAAEALRPDLGIALDVTLANDVPGASSEDYVTKLGAGTAIKVMDSSVISDFRVVDALRAIAQKKKIPYQMEVLTKGGTDTAAIQRAGGGVPAGCVSIPSRYVHSVIEMCHRKDIQASIDLLVAFLTEADKVPLDHA